MSETPTTTRGRVHGTRRPPELSSRTALTLCGTAVLLGSLVRLIPIFNNFWLDEVWSYYLARGLTSLWGVFTTIHHSNNHHLMTLLLYLLGDQKAWAIYRIPSLLAGIGTVILAARIGWQKGRLEAVLAAWLTAASFALIEFSSEARGYSMLVFFALGSYLALRRYLADRSTRSALGFAALVILGFLSQLIFLSFYVGAVAWSAWSLLRSRSGRAVTGFVRLHLLPAACLLLLYLIDLRRMQVGGGDPWRLDEVLASTLGYTLGLPLVRTLAYPYAALGAVILVLGLIRLRRDGDDAWVLHLLAIAVVPAAAIALAHPTVVAVRYFIVGIALFLLLAAFLLARLIRHAPWGRIAGLALLALFLLGNGLHTAGFFRDGRGGYLKAIQYMAEHTAGSKVVVGLDHDFRTGTVLHFYARYLPPGKELAYYPQGQWPPQGPEWVITHKVSRPAAPAARIGDPAGNTYALAAEFNYAGTSGFYWAVYHNLGMAEPGPPNDGRPYPS